MSHWDKIVKRRQKLPHCDELFLRFFDRWYDKEARLRRPYKATRPDLERIYRPGIPAAHASLLTPDAQEREKKMIRTMTEAAHSDGTVLFKMSVQSSLEWVDAFDKYYDRQKINKVIERSDPSSFSNDYLVYCCEFGAVIAEALQSLKPELEWLYDRPYWESALFDSASGSRLNVFHWAIKKMSEYGVDDGYAAKIRACLEELEGISKPAY